MNKIFKGIYISSGIINTAIFNYNMYNVDVIRNNKRTKFLIFERLTYSFYAFCFGIFNIPVYINYAHIRLLNENPENYGLKCFPKKEIDENKIREHI